MNDLADKYHDATGRPIPQPAAPKKSPRIVEPKILEPWQERLRDQAAEMKAAGVPNTPQDQAAYWRDKEIKAKGIASLKQAAAGDPASDDAIAAAAPRYRRFIDEEEEAKTHANRPPPPLPEPIDQTVANAAWRAQIGQRETAAREARTAQYERDRQTTATDLVDAEEAVAETLAKYATPSTIDPPPAPAATPIPPQSPEEGAKSERRREGARKAAATVRARRKDAEIKKLVDIRVGAAVEQAQDTYHRQEADAAEEAAPKAANPGIHTPRELLAYARCSNIEPELYRLAHLARESHKPSLWSVEFRGNVVPKLNTLITIRNNAKPKKAGTQ